MQKDMKFLIGGFIATVVLVIGLAFWVSKAPKNVSEISNAEILGLTANPSDYDLGKILIDGGIVTREYEIKNTTNKVMKIKKIVTSCMCTKASLSAGGKTSMFFAMEMQGDKNPPINFEIKPGEVGKVTVNFDPAAHGPQGIGAFDRIVWLYFSDPLGAKELRFKGDVVK